MSLVVQCELCGATYNNRNEGTTIISGYYAMAALTEPDYIVHAQIDCCPKCAETLGLLSNEHCDVQAAKDAMVALLATAFHARRLDMELKAAAKRNPILTENQIEKTEEEMWGSMDIPVVTPIAASEEGERQ